MLLGGKYHAPGQVSGCKSQIHMRTGRQFAVTPEISNSMEQSPFWGATQDVTRLRNPKVHYHVHKSLPLVPILSQLNPIHTATSSFLQILSNLPNGFILRRKLWICFLSRPPLTLRTVHLTHIEGRKPYVSPDVGLFSFRPVPEIKHDRHWFSESSA
jgi:hypothetical protein